MDSMNYGSSLSAELPPVPVTVPVAGSHKYLSDGEMEALSILSLITAGISLIGSGSVLVCSVYYGRVCVAEIFPTFHLAVADLLSSVFLILSSCIFLSGSSSFPGSEGSCDYIMTLVTSFYTSAFLLTITYALEALFRFRRRLSEGSAVSALSMRVVSTNWMYVAYVLSWLIPLSLAIVLMVVTHSLEDYMEFSNYTSLIGVIPRQCSSCFANFRFNENECWEQVINGEKWHRMVRLIFLIPLILAMVCNMGLYVLIGKVFKQVAMRRGLLSYHQRQEESILKKKAMLYQGIFILCWIPSVIIGILSFTPGYEMDDFYWLLLIQAILGPLHGVMNSLLYGWRRDSFRRALSEHSSLLSTNRTMSVTL